MGTPDTTGNKQRQHYEEEHPRVAAVDSATVIEIGSFLWLDTDDAKPASDFTWDTDLATTQAAFKDVFLGVAAQASAAGETDGIRFDSRSVFEFVCASATWEIGDWVAPDDNAAGDCLENHEVIATASQICVIGIVVRREPVAVTVVLVEVFSSIMAGGHCFEGPLS